MEGVFALKIVISLIVLLGFIPNLYAQQGEENAVPYGWAWSWHMGPFLPNQIPNVTEIQPSVGLRFSFPKGPRTATEYFLLSSNAHNVSLYNFSISSKSEFEFDGMFSQVYIGLDALSYKVGSADFENQFGGHFGIGLITHLGGYSHFRMDMKFIASNPGTSLYLGFGLELRYPPSEDAEEEGEDN